MGKFFLVFGSSDEIEIPEDLANYLLSYFRSKDVLFEHKDHYRNFITNYYIVGQSDEVHLFMYKEDFLRSDDMEGTFL